MIDLLVKRELNNKKAANGKNLNTLATAWFSGSQKHIAEKENMDKKEKKGIIWHIRFYQRHYHYHHLTLSIHHLKVEVSVSISIKHRQKQAKRTCSTGKSLASFADIEEKLQQQNAHKLRTVGISGFN